MLQLFDEKNQYFQYVKPTAKLEYITSQASERYVQLLLGLGRQATWRHFDNETHVSLVSDFGTDGDGPTEAVAQFLDSL